MSQEQDAGRAARAASRTCAVASLRRASRGLDYGSGRAVAAVTFLLQQPILDELDEILPSKASPAFLPEHAAVRMGAESALFPLRRARPRDDHGHGARIGFVGATLTHANGSRYKVTTAAVMTEPAWSAKTVAVGSRGDRVLVAEAHRTSRSATS